MSYDELATAENFVRDVSTDDQIAVRSGVLLANASCLSTSPLSTSPVPSMDGVAAHTDIHDDTHTDSHCDE
jgi:hypothetical protein